MLKPNLQCRRTWLCLETVSSERSLKYNEVTGGRTQSAAALVSLHNGGQDTGAEGRRRFHAQQCFQEKPTLWMESGGRLLRTVRNWSLCSLHCLQVASTAWWTPALISKGPFLFLPKYPCTLPKWTLETPTDSPVSVLPPRAAPFHVCDAVRTGVRLSESSCLVGEECGPCNRRGLSLSSHA